MTLQIKSVVLRESNCIPTDIMDICNIFPHMQVFFCQNRLTNAIHDHEDTHAISDEQRAAAPSAKRYLSDSFGKLQKLHTLALVPILPGLKIFNWKNHFSGPSGFLTLAGLPALTSLATLISVFATPDGESTGVLTASPMQVLPRSLRSLQIIVDHWSCRSLAFATPLDEIWFQPREAAVKFLSALASICAREFPDLRKALSPDEDYTSRAEGIVSPFKDRFDALGAAFNEANVVFRIVELKEYSDFYFHWQGSRE
ncbi:hypothetical protein SLS63_013411 [Diaporthe eres]|uniref:Uncharacterized protein n=1 Tax=Diaporthe eres TaxID=83184 RepID=A0ABR1NNI0_DIAER